MKKIFNIFLIVCFSFCFFSCDKNEEILLTKENYTNYLTISITMENLNIVGDNKYFTAIIKTTPKDDYKFVDCCLNLFITSTGTFITGSTVISNNGNCQLIIDSKGNSSGQVNFYTSNRYANFPSSSGIKYSFRKITGSVIK